MKWTVGTKIGSGFAVGLIILVVVGAVSYNCTNKLVDTSQWVTHTHEVLGQMDEMLSALADTETGQRGFIITAQEQYLEPYLAGTGTVRQALKRVRALTADNGEQQRRLDLLEPNVESRLATLAEGIETERNKGPEAARDWVLTGRGKKEMDDIRRIIAEMRQEERSLLKVRTDDADLMTDDTKRTILIGTVVAFLASAIAGFFITRNISTRLRAMTAAARRIAEGDLTGMEDAAARSKDEVGELASTFTAMRDNLKEMASQIGQATENVTSTSAEILASTQQQAAATKQQAATVQELTGTIEEINQSGAQIGERAKQVSATVEATSNASVMGLKATRETSQTMESIREQVEEVAENIVALCERTQTIGDIISTVSDIAEQSNLLALNASIEAASAGASGSRFSVIAHEMKNLSDRAKDCTVQVRTILGEVQKGINSSVMLAEGAVKRVESGRQQATDTESTINQMSSVTERSLQAFEQILGGTNQQQIGVAQVLQGMQDIRQAVTQTAAGTSQLEKAAANLNALSHQLRTAVKRYKI